MKMPVLPFASARARVGGRAGARRVLAARAAEIDLLARAAATGEGIFRAGATDPEDRHDHRGGAVSRPIARLSGNRSQVRVGLLLRVPGRARADDRRGDRVVARRRRRLPDRAAALQLARRRPACSRVSSPSCTATCARRASRRRYSRRSSFSPMRALRPALSSGPGAQGAGSTCHRVPPMRS